MSRTFLLPPSLGYAKAASRAELVESAFLRQLDEPVKARVARSYGELEEQINMAKTDLAWAPAAVCAKVLAVRALFTIVRQGQPSYRSALVARRGSGITLETLQGTRAVWVDPLSAGGYLLAAAMLRAESRDPDQVFRTQAFLGSHRATVEAVLHGEADVTAISILDTNPAAVVARLRWYAGPLGDKLEVIAFTERCLNDALVLTMALPPPDAERIVSRIIPATRGEWARSRILSALEADGLLEANLVDYHQLVSRLTPPASAEKILQSPASRKTMPPPRGK